MSSWLNARARRSLSHVDLRNPLADHELNQGRAAWWLALPGRFGGPIWWDLVAGMPGTLTNFTAGYGWSPQSYPGGAGSVKVNNGDGYVSIPTLPISGSCWMAVWFNTLTLDYTANSAGVAGLFAKGLWGGDSNGDVRLTIEQSGGSYLTLSVYTSAANYSAHYNLTNVATNTWHRLFGVFNQGTNNALLYLDATQVASVTTSGALSSNTHPFRIGAYPNNEATTAWNGWLNDATFGYGVPTPSAIQADYQLGPQGYPGVLRRRRRTAYSVPSVTPSGIVFRKTLSGIGTRVGQRQPQRVWGGL